MSRSNCSAPIAFSTLVEYWLGETDDAATAQIDEHLLGCGECSRRLAEIVELSGGIRAAFGGGLVRAVVTDGFVRSLIERGVRVREYRVPHNGSVNCSIAPEDEVAIGRLEAPLAGVSRVDIISRRSIDATEEVIRDIPFDAARGEVISIAKIKHLRSLPSHQHCVRLVAVDAGGERVIGDYVFNHAALKPLA